jgi:hypothetical protein
MRHYVSDAMWHVKLEAPGHGVESSLHPRCGAPMVLVDAEHERVCRG